MFMPFNATTKQINQFEIHFVFLNLHDNIWTKIKLWNLFHLIGIGRLITLVPRWLSIQSARKENGKRFRMLYWGRCIFALRFPLLLGGADSWKRWLLLISHYISCLRSWGGPLSGWEVVLGRNWNPPSTPGYPVSPHLTPLPLSFPRLAQFVFLLFTSAIPLFCFVYYYLKDINCYIRLNPFANPIAVYITPDSFKAGISWEITVPGE